ncbi:MAG: RNA polymerase sigma factor, partial [Acidobacteriota bacterium]
MGKIGASEDALLERLRQAVEPEEKRLLLGQLLEPYLKRISRWSLRLRGDPQQAADLAQDALAAICTHIHRFRGESRFSTWIYTILRNQAAKQYALQQRRGESPLEEHPEPLSPASGPAEQLNQQKLWQEARGMLRTVLTPLEA